MTFIDVSADYRRAILSILGLQLKSLMFYGCPTIDVRTELLPYSQLNKLKISSDCALLPIPVTDEFPQRSAQTFLPQPKTLKINCCLGSWSPLFECQRPTLTKLKLRCPHLGIASTSRYDWIDIPQLFPNLRKLYIKQGLGLTVEIYEEITTNLNHLEFALLPRHNVNTQLKRQEFKKLKTQLRMQEFPNGPVIKLSSSLITNLSSHFL